MEACDGSKPRKNKLGFITILCRPTVDYSSDIHALDHACDS